MEDKGITGLAYWHNGVKQLSSNKAMHEPKDARGLKFQRAGFQRARRAVQRDSRQPAQDELLGGLPGPADRRGQRHREHWSNYYSQKVHEVQKYMTESDHGLIDHMVITKTKFWALPEDVRTELEAVMAEVTVEVNRQADELNQKDKQAIAGPAPPRSSS